MRIFRSAETGDAVLLCLSLAITAMGAYRQWPFQNCVAIMAGLAIVGGTVCLIRSQPGFPFRVGFSISSWFVSFIWVVVVLNCRGAAQRILSPWRDNARYGYWLLALTVLLAVVFSFALETYAVEVRRYWVPAVKAGQGNAPLWANAAAWGLTAFFVLLLLTPWFVKKRPGAENTPLVPLLTYLVLVGFLVAVIADPRSVRPRESGSLRRGWGGEVTFGSPGQFQPFHPDPLSAIDS